MIPRGSKTALMDAARSSASGGFDRKACSAFNLPRPCSAETEPRAAAVARRPRAQGSGERRYPLRRRRRVGIEENASAGAETLRWRLPSPRWP